MAQPLHPRCDFRGGRVTAGAWRRRFAVPLARSATATVCSNASVLQTGRSLAALVHPLLPLCILGYGRKPVLP